MSDSENGAAPVGAVLEFKEATKLGGWSEGIGPRFDASASAVEWVTWPTSASSLRTRPSVDLDVRDHP